MTIAAIVAALWFVVRLLLAVLTLAAFVLVFGDDREDDDGVLHGRLRGIAVGLAFWFFLWVTS